MQSARLERRLSGARKCKTQARTVRASHIARGLKENIAKLPSIDAVAQVTLQPLNHSIPNAPGKKASVAIYSYLASKYGGKLTVQAAQAGLELYGEYVAEARNVPGSHPNIDVLLDVVSKDAQLTIEVTAQ